MLTDFYRIICKSQYSALADQKSNLCGKGIRSQLTGKNCSREPTMEKEQTDLGNERIQELGQKLNLVCVKTC